MCSGFKPKARFYGLLGLKNRHFYAVPGTAGKSSSADKPRGSAEALENSRICKGRLSYLSANDSRGQGYDGGSMYYAFASQNVKTMVSMQEENIPADPAIDLSRSNSLYQDGLNEVRVNALFGLHLIRAYQA